MAVEINKELAVPKGYYKVGYPVNAFAIYYARWWEFPYSWVKVNLPKIYWKYLFKIVVPIIGWHMRKGRLKNIEDRRFKFKWFLGVK